MVNHCSRKSKVVARRGWITQDRYTDRERLVVLNGKKLIKIEEPRQYEFFHINFPSKSI